MLHSKTFLDMRSNYTYSRSRLIPRRYLFSTPSPESVFLELIFTVYIFKVIWQINARLLCFDPRKMPDMWLKVTILASPQPTQFPEYIANVSKWHTLIYLTISGTSAITKLESLNLCMDKFKYLKHSYNKVTNQSLLCNCLWLNTLISSGIDFVIWILIYVFHNLYGSLQLNAISEYHVGHCPLSDVYLI